MNQADLFCKNARIDICRIFADAGAEYKNDDLWQKTSKQF